MASGVPGRNDPCPCGSGKKYKKCCWGREEAGPARIGGTPVSSEDLKVEREILDEMEADLQQLNDWSHEAREAIKQERYEDAERLSRKIQDRFPDLIEGPSVLAQVRMAQGRWADAADAYAYAINFIEGDPNSFDPEVLQEMRRGLEAARSKAATSGG